jgi:hypothetical protein
MEWRKMQKKLLFPWVDLKKNIFGINSMTEKILFFILPHTNADLYWGGFSTHWGNKKPIDGADEEYTIGRI